MGMVYHGSDAIKTETIKMVHVNPPSQIWQQKPWHFPSTTDENKNTFTHHLPSVFYYSAIVQY